MTFLQRVANFLFDAAASTYFQSVYLHQQDSLLRKHFGDGHPHLKRIMTNTSLVLVNHHNALGAPRPYLPNMIEIGGYHVRPPKPLPNVSLNQILQNPPVPIDHTAETEPLYS